VFNRNDILQMAGRDTDINEYLLSLYNIPVQMNAKVLVELGAGQSTYALTAVANKTNGHLWSIDYVSDAHLRLYPEGKGVLEKEKSVTFIVGDSVEASVAWKKEIDFLLIDTNNRYEHTVNELKAWTPFVKTGGVIMMHDTASTDPIHSGCRKALDEFLAENEHYKAVHLLDTKFLGMSVIFCV